MRILQQELEHPTQASRVRLDVYRYEPPSGDAVPGMLPEREGFLVTEDRIGSVTVVASLGFFAQEAQARERLAQRAQELARQGWRPSERPMRGPSIPPGALVASEPESANAALASPGRDPDRVPIPGEDTPRPVKPA